MENNAFETIKELVRNKTAVMNLYAKHEDCKPETLERFRHELTAMLVCLKNICTDGNFYCVNYWENGYEFGYFDTNGSWKHIEGVSFD